MTKPQSKLAPELLRRLFKYNPQTGALTWRRRSVSLFPDSRAAKSWNSRYAGQPALAVIISNGYRGGTIFGAMYRAHRVIWAIIHGDWPQSEIDHINGDRSDNRIANLRDVDRIENARNVSVSARNISGQLGVRRINKGSGSWVATITTNKKRKHLGYFKKKSDAIAARRAAETELGFHHNHGRPPCQAC